MELTKDQRIFYIKKTADVSADLFFNSSPNSSMKHNVSLIVDAVQLDYSYYYKPISSIITQDDSVYNFPFLLHRDGRPWYEANSYLWSIASDYKNLATATDRVQNIASSLLEYLIFCENNQIDYLDFSAKRAIHRPSTKYFNSMVESGLLSAGTINDRTGKMYYFLDWLFKQPGYENDIDRVDQARDYTHFFESGTGQGSVQRKIRTLTVSQSSEANPVEFGKIRDEGEDLRPLSASERKELVEILSRKEFTVDERLIAQIALFTGVRKQTVLTLRMKHIALLDNKDLLLEDDTYKITAGPGTGIDTKFSRKYSFYVPANLAEDLVTYAKSNAAKKRRDKFKENYLAEHPDLAPISDDDMYVFLSDRGNCHYMAKDDPRYKVLQKHARPKGKRTELLCKKISQFASGSFPKDFIFHWLRATFAFRYYENLLKIEEDRVEKGKQKRPRRIDQILRDVMVRLCHRDIRVTESYLNLFENYDERQEAQNAYENHIFRDYEREFLGAKNDNGVQ